MFLMRYSRREGQERTLSNHIVLRLGPVQTTASVSDSYELREPGMDEFLQGRLETCFWSRGNFTHKSIGNITVCISYDYSNMKRRKGKRENRKQNSESRFLFQNFILRGAF